MPDYQRVVQDVRTVLRSGDQTLNDRLRDLAAQFQTVCVSGANRLQRCEEYVFQGRRSEAVQLAQAQPPLLDLLGAVSFPERAGWDELMAMYGLPASPTVELGRAAAVNKAFSELQPLQPLVQEHRRLALRRASPLQRLTVLRQLYQCDSANPVWPQQIGQLEAERSKEMRPALDLAVRKNDVDGMLVLWQELSETPWLAPPADLIESAQAAVGFFQQQKAKANLQQICQELQQALKARDVVVAQDLRVRWDQEAARANLSPSDPLTSAAGRPLEWLSDMEVLLGNLNKRDLSAEDVQYQYRLMDRWQNLLPINLETRYDERVKQMGRDAVNRDRVILALVLSGCAIITVLLIVWFTYIF